MPCSPEFAKLLDADAYDTDSHYSVIDPVKRAAYEKASEGPTHLGQSAGLAAHAYLSKGSRAAAACVCSLLDAAAKADARTGQMPHFQDVYIQNWMDVLDSVNPLRLVGQVIPVVDSGVFQRRCPRQLMIPT